MSIWQERNDRNTDLLKTKALTYQQSCEQVATLTEALILSQERFQTIHQYVNKCALEEERVQSNLKIATGRTITDKADADSATRAVQLKQVAVNAAIIRSKLLGSGNEARRKNDERLLTDELLSLKRIEAKKLDISDASEAQLVNAKNSVIKAQIILKEALQQQNLAEKEIENLKYKITSESKESNKLAADYQIAKDRFSVMTPTLEPRHIRANALTSTFLLRDTSLLQNSSLVDKTFSSTTDERRRESIREFDGDDYLINGTGTSTETGTETESRIRIYEKSEKERFIQGEKEMDILPFNVRPPEPVGPESFQPLAKPLTLRGQGNLSLSATEPVAALARKDYAAYDNSLLVSSPRRPATVLSQPIDSSISSSLSSSTKSRRRIPIVPEYLSSAEDDLSQLRLLRTELESSLSALQTASKDLEAFSLKNPRDIDAIDAVTRSRATARRYLNSLEDLSKTFEIVLNDVDKAVRPPTK